MKKTLKLNNQKLTQTVNIQKTFSAEQSAGQILGSPSSEFWSYSKSVRFNRTRPKPTAG